MARLSVVVPLLFLGLCLVGETLSSICCVMPVAVEVACNRTTASSPINSVHDADYMSDDGNVVPGTSQDTSDQEQDENRHREQDENQHREDDQNQSRDIDQSQQREDDQSQQREDDQSQQREDDRDQDAQDQNAGSDELATDASPMCVAYYCGSVEHTAGNVPCSYGTCDSFGCHCTAECIDNSYRTKKSIR